MIVPIRHQHSNMASLSVTWFSSDSEEAYLQNMQNAKRKDIIESNGWNESNVSYTFNSHGFRADEFDGSDAIMFLGCSITLGTGVPDNISWARIVSKHFGLKNYNLGISGGSNDTAFRLANHYVPQLRPRLVVFMGTSAHRFDIIDDCQITTLMYNYTPEPHDTNWYKDWLLNPENGNLNWQKNWRGIQYICKKNKVPFAYISASPLLNAPFASNGRDIVHPGKSFNLEHANVVINQIEPILKAHKL